MSTIAVIDYGMGNLHSVVQALRHVADAGTKVQLKSDPEAVLQADRIVFPGQGAARDCMFELKKYGLDEAIVEAARNKPFLGICMGMQVLVDYSQENDGTECLGIYPGQVRFFGDVLGVKQSDDRFKIPHMGWNQVSQRNSHPLWKDIANDSYFYFVHSYYLDTDQSNLVAGTTEYGIDFTSVISHENVFAMQCHPEKSAAAGLTVLHNFAHWDGMGAY